jgi:hypothetical protein
MALELVAGIGGEEVVPFAVATGSHPEKETNFSGQTESFQELGHEKRQTFVVVGDGKALDEMVDGNADAYGEKGEAFNEKMGLKAGVSCKQFISTIPAENGLHLSSGQTGKKPCRH